MGVLLSVAKGTSTVTESVWDNRFRYVDELRKMGANVQVDGQVAVFEGVEKLSPAPLRATDLRAGAAMVVAALMADGTSEVEEIGYIERGYENIVESCARWVLISRKWSGCPLHWNRPCDPQCLNLSRCIPALPATAAWCAAATITLSLIWAKACAPPALPSNRWGLNIADCDGILVTHEHSDHVKGLSTFLKKESAPGLRRCGYTGFSGRQRHRPAHL